MDKEVLNFTIEKTHELMNSASCSTEARSAAENWLNALGSENEISATSQYINELEADIMPVSTLISLAESDTSVQIFGAETAKHIAAHAREIKSQGSKYCDCPACAAVEAILQNKDAFIN